MPKRKDEMSPRAAAKESGYHIKTIYGWCHKAMAGERSPLGGVVRSDETGHYWIKKTAFV